MKTAERDEARRLRQTGWSIKEIEQHLGVSRGSVSSWVRDVEPIGAARERLAQRAGLGARVSAERKAQAARETRRAYQERGRLLARERDATYAAGCVLYWAEGAKSRNVVDLVNSDPEVLVFFIGFLRRHFGVPNARIRIACRLFPDHVEHQRAIEQHWLDRLDLPRECLRRSIVNRYSKYSEKKRTNRLPYGTCALVVCSTEIVQTIYGSIQELGGFDRPEWLG
ncbi:MAG TPA: hypothetical protein VGC78_03595 [Gaiellaceae bacterium]